MADAVKIILVVTLLLQHTRFSLAAIKPPSKEPEGCDEFHEFVEEGILGQVAQFPWLGILKVHFHDKERFRVAVTGVILVQKYFALINSDDIARVPQEILLDDSKVMFILEQNVAWYCQVVELFNHPQFEITTQNTIAVVRLKSTIGKFLPKPICWPHVNLKTSEMYYIGYTDEHEYLEKVIHKLEYLPKEPCDEFHNRVEQHNDDMSKPVSYLCGYGVRFNKTCEWDNGMAIATNTSGLWILVGMTVKGPGCAAPHRFLDIYTYLDWIRMTTDENGMEKNEDPDAY